MIKNLTYLILYYCLSLFSAGANNIKFESFGLKDGLSSSTVNTIYKSKNNLIWLGTERGVDLFTGNQFIPLDHFIVDSSSIVKTSITAITELQPNKLWVGTWGDGLFSVDIETGDYTHYKANDLLVKNTVSDNYINCLHVQDDEIWIGSIFCLSQTKGDGEFIHYNFEEVLTKSIPDIRGIIPKYEYLLSVFTNNGEIIELNTQTGTYNKVKEINSPTANISSIKKDKLGRYWIGTEVNDIIVLDENYNEITIPTSLSKIIDSSHISDIAIHPNGDILLSSDGSGLFIIDQDDFSWQNITSSLHNNNSLVSNQLQSTIIDKDGILWVGYFKDGFSKTVYKNDGISHFYKTGSKNGELPNKNVNGFAEDKANNIWIGTEDGITILNSKLHPIQFSPIHNLVKKELNGIPVTAMSSNKQKDKIYIGTYNKGLFIADLKTNKVQNFNKENSKLSSNFIRDVKEVNDTLVYTVAVGGGLYRFNGTDFDLIKIFYQNRYDIKDFLHINVINPTMLWLSCAGKGVMRINTRNGSGEVFDKVVSTICYSSYTTSDSCIFITTNKGVFKYNPELNDYDLVKNTDQNTDFYGITEANDGALWISSSTGLFRYDRNRQSLKNINSINIQNREFLPGAFCKHSDGRFLFGGTNGFNIINADNYKLNSGKPSIFFSNFKVYNQQVKPGTKPTNKVLLNRQINFVKTLHIPADINLFSIHVNVINYLNYSNNRVAYTIKNGNKESGLMYTENEIGFLNLNPGTYIISIFPINKLNNKALLSEGRTITIYKAKPWWQSYWLYAGILICALLSIIALHKLKVREYKQSKLLLEETVSKKTATLLLQKDTLLSQRDELKKILSENTKLESFKESMISMIIHDLKNPLNGIIGLSSLNEAEYLEHINSASRQMLHLVENILDVRRYETHSLKLFYQLCDIRQLMNEAIDDVRFLLKDSDIEIINLISPTQISVDKDIIRRVFINLLTNAIKYSPLEGKIQLKSNVTEVQSEKSLLLSVKDDGQGIPPQFKDSIFDLYQQVNTKKSGQTNSNGLGLSFCKIAIEEHGGTIWVESEREQGSTFFIQIPLGNA